MAGPPLSRSKSLAVALAGCEVVPAGPAPDHLSWHRLGALWTLDVPLPTATVYKGTEAHEIREREENERPRGGHNRMVR